MINKIVNAWNWIKNHERVQGIFFVLFIEFIGLMIIYSIKCST